MRVIKSMNKRNRKRFTFTLNPHYIVLAKRLVKETKGFPKGYKSVSSLVERSLEETFKKDFFFCNDCEELVPITKRSRTPNTCIECEMKKNNIFRCNSCKEMGRIPEDLSDTHNICKICAIIKKAIKDNKCLNCSGENPKKTYWGWCKKCRDNEIEYMKIQNKKHLKKMGITQKEQDNQLRERFVNSKSIAELKEQEGSKK